MEDGIATETIDTSGHIKIFSSLPRLGGRIPKQDLTCCQSIKSVFNISATLLSAAKPLTHLLVVCVLVNSTSVIPSWLSQWREMSLGSLFQMVFCHKGFCVNTSGHCYYMITQLDRAVARSMSDCKRAQLGSRPVHWDPFCAVRPPAVPPDEKYCVLPCRTAVVFPVFFCVMQMAPGPPSVNITVVAIADNQVTGDEVHRWVGP